MKNKINLIAVAAIFLFGCASCSKEDKDVVKEVELQVASKYENCNLSFTDTPSEHCLKVTTNGQNSSFFLAEDAITGFAYKEGFDYTLLVKQTKLANPPMDDSDTRYELVRVLSKKEVD